MATTSKRSLVSRAKAALSRKSVESAGASASNGSATKAGTQKKTQKSTQSVKKAAPKKAAATKAPAKKTAKKAAPAAKTAKKEAASKTAKVAAKKPAEKATAKAAPTKAAPGKTPAKKAPAKKAASSARLVVLEQEDPWTKQELAEVRNTLKTDIKRLTGELAESEVELADMISSSDGAGQDTADIGSASFERDQEMTIVANARIMLEQSEHALERIADRTYGVCEICGNPIGKNRLMAFPRATMCLSCKQREERR